MSDSKKISAPLVIEMTDVAVPSARKPNALSVKAVNWCVTAGDYWVVTGLEGAGKSDLMMMTAGLIKPVSGTYRLFGEPMPIFEGERLTTRLRLGLVFDEGRLFNHLTLAENIALPLQYHPTLSTDTVGETLQEILELTELTPWANRIPGTVAWSWQKRAALARAIALRPEVLLLDDPLRGLDARHASWWTSFLDRLSSGCKFTRNRQMTLVITTGMPDHWKKRARQFAVMKRGEFAVQDSSEQLIEKSTGSGADEFYSGTATI